MNTYEKLGALANYLCTPMLEKNKCSITLVDNPGWAITIDLANTIVENVDFTPVVHGLNADDLVTDYDNWCFCYIKNNVFYGGCAPDQLKKMLDIFFDLLEKHNFDYSQYASAHDRAEKLFWAGAWATIHGK